MLYNVKIRNHEKSVKNKGIFVKNVKGCYNFLNNL